MARAVILPSLAKRARRRIGVERRRWWAMDNIEAFRLGYISAVNDIERTGLRPTTDKTKREAADRALGPIVDPRASVGEGDEDG